MHFESDPGLWSIYWHLDLCQFNSLVTLWHFWPNIFQLLWACFLGGLFCFLYIKSLCFEVLWQWFGVVHVGGFITWQLPRKGMLRHSHQHLSSFPLVVSERISPVSQSKPLARRWPRETREFSCLIPRSGKRVGATAAAPAGAGRWNSWPLWTLPPHKSAPEIACFYTYVTP